MKDLKGRVVRGGIVTISGQTAKVLLRMGSLVVLARMLDPRDFGLVGMVSAVTGVFEIVKDAGLSAVTVQRANITEEQISTLFWINMMVGTMLGLLSLAIAPVLVSFYHEPSLFWVTVVLASGFVFNAAAIQHSALLQRQMRFATLMAADIISLLVSIAVGIGMAAGGLGYWALVGMGVVQPAVLALCVWFSTRWIPGMPRRNVGMRSMLQFGGTVSLNAIVIYLAYNLEKVLLGRFWGAETLGIYGRAYQLINLPTSLLNSSVGSVAFPTLSRLQDDPDRFKNYFLKGYSLVLALTLLATFACALFADDIINIILGPKWKDAASIFRLLAPTVLVLGMINPTGWLLLSMGRAGRSLKIALVIAPLVIVAYFIGLPYGPNGVALAYSAAMTLWLIPHIVWCIHGTMFSLRDFLSAAGRPLLSATVATALTYTVLWFCAQSMAPLLRLILGAGVMLLVHLWMLLYVMGQKSFYLDLLRGLKG